MGKVVISLRKRQFSLFLFISLFIFFLFYFREMFHSPAIRLYRLTELES